MRFLLFLLLCEQRLVAKIEEEDHDELYLVDTGGAKWEPFSLLILSHPENFWQVLSANWAQKAKLQ